MLSSRYPKPRFFSAFVPLLLLIILGRTSSTFALQPQETHDTHSALHSVEAHSSNASLPATFILTSVSLQCDHPDCSTPDGRNLLLQLTNLHPNRTLSSSDLNLARQTLLATQRFQEVSFETSTTTEGVALTIRATSAKTIRRIVFEGLRSPPFESDLQKLVIFRRGQILPSGPDPFAAQINSFKMAFNEAGVFDIDIQVDVQENDDNPLLVDVIYHFDHGKRYTVCNIGIRGLNALSYLEASDLLLSASSFWASRLNIIDIDYSDAMFAAGRDALIARYREKGYLLARIVNQDTRFEDTCAYLIVDVVEGPKWEILFEGSTLFSNSELRAEIPLLNRSFIDASEVNHSADAIQGLYQTRGFPFASVRGEVEKVSEIERRVTFHISEGPRLEIDSITFHGNTSLTAPELLATMRTQPYSLFAKGGFLQMDELIADFSNIEAAYHKRGYLLARVIQFSLQQEGQKLQLDITIDERQPVRLTQIKPHGNQQLASSEILNALSLRAGQPLIPEQIQQDVATLKQLYAAHGYANATIQPVCSSNNQAIACAPPRFPPECLQPNLRNLPKTACKTSKDATFITCQRLHNNHGCTSTFGISKHAVDLQFEIQEGPQLTVGPVFIQGNNLTKSSIITRELELHSGDFFNTTQSIKSQGNLRDLNIFQSVSIEPIPLPQSTSTQPHVIPILVSLEESKQHNISLKLGFEIRDFLDGETQYLITGEASYTNRNLFGFAQSIQPHIIAAVNPIDLFKTIGTWFGSPGTPSRPLDFLFGSEIIYSHPRFMKDWFGIDRLLLTISPYYLIDLIGITQTNTLREEWGIRTQLRKQYLFDSFRIDTKFGLEVFQSAHHGLDDPVVDSTRIFSPRRLVGKISPEIAFDSRDSPLNPTSGAFVKISPEIFTGDVLQSGQETPFTDSFLRLRLQASFFLKFWDSVILAQSFRYGQIIPFAGRTELVPSTERFFLGGVRSVRGFPSGSLGPLGRLNQAPIGGEFMLNYNAELRYPILPQIGLFGASFFDAGLLADCRTHPSQKRNCLQDAFSKNSLESIRMTAGLGIRLLILDQIPIVLDYGVVLNRQPTEKFGQLNFNIGYTFD